MSEEQSPVRKTLAEELRSGEVSAVVMHREAEVPAEVAEAAVRDGLPVFLTGREGNS